MSKLKCYSIFVNHTDLMIFIKQLRSHLMLIIFSNILVTFEDFERTLTPETPSLDITCPSSCEGLDPGPYQSCAGCNQYMMCFDNDTMLDGLLCEASLEWDDFEKACVLHSSTCPNPSTATTALPDEETTFLPAESKTVICSFMSSQIERHIDV